MKKYLHCLFCFLLISALLAAASVDVSAGSDIPNVSLSEEGVLSWDPYQGATRYWIIMGSDSFEPEGNSADLYARACLSNFPTGEYTFSLVACDDNWNNLSDYYYGKYSFTAPIGLDEVKNPRWEGKTAVWDPVDGAAGYNVYLFSGDNNVDVNYVEQTSYDFSDSIKLVAGNEYRFSVMAIAEGDKPNGTMSDFSGTIPGWFEYKDIQNVKIENGILSWDAFDGATRYWIRLSSGGAYEPDGTSFNINEKIGYEGGIDGETYTFDLVACLSDWTEISKHYSETYVYEKDDTPPPVYSISISTEGEGTAFATPESGPDGTVVTITAVPDSGYVFREWLRAAGMISGGLDIPNATSATTSFTISGYNVQLTAVFEKDAAMSTDPVVTDEPGDDSSSTETNSPETNAPETNEPDASSDAETDKSVPASTGASDSTRGLKTALIIVSSLLGIVVIAGAVAAVIVAKKIRKGKN